MSEQTEIEANAEASKSAVEPVVRLRTLGGEYVHAVHGVVCVSYVMPPDIEKAALFPVGKTPAERWRATISSIAGRELVVEQVETA